MSSVLVGMFDTQGEAERARANLLSAGFSSAATTMTGGSYSSAESVGNAQVHTPQEEGPIARFFDNLFGGGENDRIDRADYHDTYNEAFRRGSYGVTVTADDDAELAKAESILNAAGAIDIDERSQEWRKEGWTGRAAALSSGTGTGSTSTSTGKTLDAGTSRTLQEVEEELKIGKRTVARGGVRIFSRMTEVPVEESVRLREEHADIQRRTVDRPATEADFAAFKEGSIEVRETAEEAVVSKTARVVGEVEIGKTETEREETIRDTVRKTKVDVERIDGAAVTDSSSVRARLSDDADATTPSTSFSGSPNRDPLTGDPGAHPVGTGLGAAAGGLAAGAAVGTAAGPVGTLVGAAAGAVAGGLAGKGMAEAVDPTDNRRTK